jgi:hypothetical protein
MQSFRSSIISYRRKCCALSIVHIYMYRKSTGRKMVKEGNKGKMQNKKRTGKAKKGGGKLKF